MARTRMWTIENADGPTRIDAYSGHRERDLEDWIEKDPSMLMDGLQWVRRQAAFSGDRSRLDLLGLVFPNTWVVAELKADAIDAGTIHQALGYALNLATMSRAELEVFIGNPSGVDADALRAALEGEPNARQIHLMLVGTSKAPKLQTAIDFLRANGLRMPISAVTFELFRRGDGPIFMTRTVEEVLSDEEREPSNPSQSIEPLMRLANEYGVAAEVECVRAWASDAGLRVRAWPGSLAIYFSKNRTKTMVYVAPLPDRIRLGYVPSLLAQELGVTEEAVTAALGEPYTAREPASVRSFVNAVRKLYTDAGLLNGSVTQT